MTHCRCMDGPNEPDPECKFCYGTGELTPVMIAVPKVLVERAVHTILQLSAIHHTGRALRALLGDATPFATQVESLARNIAVGTIDASHGYTAEFAPSYAAHIEEYDTGEIAARYELERFFGVKPPEWVWVKDVAEPRIPGMYRVMYAGDNDPDLPYSDYQGWAEWSIEDPDCPNWITEHDEAPESIFAYYGPYILPDGNAVKPK